MNWTRRDDKPLIRRLVVTRHFSVLCHGDDGALVTRALCYGLTAYMHRTTTAWRAVE